MRGGWGTNSLERAVVVVDNGNGGRGRAVGTDRRHRKDDLLEFDGRRLDGIERLAAAARDKYVGLLAGGGVHNLGDIGARAVGAVDTRLQNLDVGSRQRGFDSGKRRGQRSFATDDCDLGRSVLGQRAGQLVKAILADGIVAHSNRAHSSLLSLDKVLSGILLQEKASDREKFLKYETDVEGFSPALTVLPYSAEALMGTSSRPSACYRERGALRARACDR